jgi:hypothetical protein
MSGAITLVTMRKASKRKVWYVKGSGLELAISGATKTSESDLDKLRMLELSAIEAFAKGMASRAEFSQLCDLLNLCETMADMGIEPEAKTACEVAQKGLLETKDRFDRTGKLGFDAATLTAVRALFGWHDVQRKGIARSTYERAIVKCRNRIRGAHPSRKVLL